MKWIPVSDGVPAGNELVLTLAILPAYSSPHVFSDTRYCHRSRKWIHAWTRQEAKGVTHWMPWPQPPESN